MAPDRESILTSTFRSLCNALGVVLGAFLALMLVIFTIVAFSPSENLPEKSELTLAPDAEGKRVLLPSSSPAILRINLQGVIGLDALTTENFQNLLSDSLESPLGSTRIKAIFLYVNTPGGTVTDSASMYQALLDYKKKYNVPVYAFVDGLCASGGMYICSAADKIYASDSSLIGSVGVRMGPSFNFSDLMTKVGVQAITITQGKDKDSLNPFRPWKPDEDASFTEITKELYEQFVNIVISGRPNLNREKLTQEYGAQVFLAPTAQKFGYIDVAGADYALAMKDLVAASSIGENPYQVITLSRPENFFSQLTQSKFALLTGKVEHIIHLGPYMSTELSGQLLYLYQP